MNRRYEDYDADVCAELIVTECVISGSSQGWSGSLEELEAIKEICSDFNVKYVDDFLGKWAVVKPVSQDSVTNLTPEDIEYLKRIGYKKTDIPQIEEAIRLSTYTLVNNNYKELGSISVECAIGMLNRHDFLFGIARSAFHWSAMRASKDFNYIVLFDSSAFLSNQPRK